MTLHLTPDIEARLVELARSNGVSVEAFLQRVVEEKSGTKATEHVLGSEEWNRSFGGCKKDCVNAVLKRTKRGEPNGNQERVD